MSYSKYIVHDKDSLWSIALLQLGNGTRYSEIAKLNNLNADSIITPGQTLLLPNNNTTKSTGTQYKIQSGDNLLNIAQRYGISVLDILNKNNISNPNLIKVGDTINIPVFSTYNKLTILNFNTILARENLINSLSDLDIINTYHKNRHDNLVYIVDDKKNNKLSVYKNGILLRLYNAIHGKNRQSDAMTVTHTDKSGNIINLAGNLSTPAGIYFTTKGGNYHGAPSFIRRTLLLVLSKNPNGIPSSIHARTMYKGANTNGCTGMGLCDLKDLSKYINQPNVPTYILPYNKDNRFFVRNGNLLFRSGDINKTPAYNTFVSKPIKYITFKTDGLTQKNRLVINKFNVGLIKHKLLLLKDLGLNDDTYNKIALSALGILGVESGYGNENTGFGNLLRAARKFIFKNNSSPDYKSKFYTYGIQGDNNSVGLTQIRFKYLSKREKELFKKYGITKQSLVDNPEKAAIATVIKLGLSYLDRGSVDKAISAWNNKPSYLAQVKNNIKRFNLFEMYKNGGILKSQKGLKVPIGTMKQYLNVTLIYLALVDQGVNPLAALDITNLKVREKGWTGFATGDSKRFSNATDFAKHIVDWHGRKYPDSLKAQNFNQYWRGILVTPKEKYNSENPNYKKELLQTRPGVKKRINFYRAQQGLDPLTLMDKNPFLTNNGSLFAKNGTKLLLGGSILPEVVITGTYPRSELVFNIANLSNSNFILRMKDPNRKIIPNWSNPKQHSTHKMAYTQIDNGYIAYPEIQNINGNLYDFTDPKNGHYTNNLYKWKDAVNSALKNKDYVKFDRESDARYFTLSYKNHYPRFFKGGKILRSACALNILQYENNKK